MTEARRLVTLVVAALAVACGLAPGAPRQVTEQFWEALRGGDLEHARSLASSASAHRIEELHDLGPIEEVLLGEALRGETSAIVRTSLAIARDDGVRHLTFDTTLVRENRAWRVDVATTHRALASAAFASSVQELGDALSEGVQEFGEALEEGAAEIGRAIHEALEELERDLGEPPPDSP